MKWVTRKEVERAAGASLRAAVQCSKKHWWQLYKATPREIIGGLRSNKTNLGPHYCALCVRFDECKSDEECPLLDYGDHACCAEYATANSLLMNDDATLCNDIDWPLFKKAARLVHKRLCKL